MSTILMGIFPGSRRDPAAVCVVEEEMRNGHKETLDQSGRALREAVANRRRMQSQPRYGLERQGKRPEPERHFLVRLLERMPTGTSFLQLAERVAEMAEALKTQGLGQPTAYVDATGKGAPILDLLRDTCPKAYFVPVFFNFGDRRIEESGQITLGKAYLVSRLQLLLETSRLHLPKQPGNEQLREDLLRFESPIHADANEKYGAFPVGNQDDRVTALGLAVQSDPFQWRVIQ